MKLSKYIQSQTPEYQRGWLDGAKNEYHPPDNESDLREYRGGYYTGVADVGQYSLGDRECEQKTT